MSLPPIFIIHGLSGTPQENWYPWLHQELSTAGYNVTTPQFPNAANPKLSEWQDTLKLYENILQQKPIIIAHSLGVPFALTILEHYAATAAFFVGGFYSSLNHRLDAVRATFTDRTFQWDMIKQHCQKFTIIHSNNDPYVALSKAENLAKQLNATVTLIPNAGHFNTKSGYTTFPWLLEQIKQLCS